MLIANFTLQYDGLYVVCICNFTCFVVDFALLDGPGKGIIPLTCSELFVRVKEKMSADSNLSFTVEVSYIEVCAYFTG